MSADEKKAKQPLTEADITTAPVGRRAAMTMLGAGAISLGLEAAGCGRRYGYGGGCTDADPYDRAGYGRRCRGYGGCSDRDPYDPVGRGRRC